jgi:protease-4
MSDPIIDPSHAIPAASQLRRSRFRWRIVAFVALVIAILAGVGRYATENGLGGVTDSIARVEIDGTIATDAARLKVFETIGEDANVKAVLIAINSPGGTTAGGEELYDAINKLRAKKPVVAYVKELGASAAYMAAIAADRIFVRRLSIVGSIGVLFQTANAQKLMQTIGVDLEKVQSGPLKAEPDLDEPMSDEVRASLQSLVDDSFSWFVDIVAERRGLTRAEVLPLADGRIMTGNQGIANKLVDEVGGEAEAIAWLEANKSVAADLPVATWYPTAAPCWMAWENWLGQARTALGLPARGPVVLDGLVSLWQVAAD